MIIKNRKSHDKLNFDKRLLPLFKAMKTGKIIRSVTLLNPRYRNNREKDFVIENFLVMSYWIAREIDLDGSNLDEVITDKGDFFMKWVISYEI